MKRVLLLLIALCLLGSSALADTYLSWEDEAANSEKYDGAFQTFDEINMKIWIPSEYEALALTDEYRNAGYIGYFRKPDTFHAIAVQYIDAGLASLDDYRASLEEYISKMDPNDPASITLYEENVLLNNIPCLIYLFDDGTGYGASVIVSFITERGYVLEVSYRPAPPPGDEEAAALFNVVISSVQPG